MRYLVLGLASWLVASPLLAVAVGRLLAGWGRPDPADQWAAGRPDEFAGFGSPTLRYDDPLRVTDVHSAPAPTTTGGRRPRYAADRCSRRDDLRPAV